MDVTAQALRGPRIRLRELRESDLGDLVAWWQDPEVLVTQTSGPFHPGPFDGHPRPRVALLTEASS